MSLKETIEQINAQLSKLDDGKRIRFLNINDKLADTEGKLLEGMSSDGLHLESKAYDVWAEALKPILTEIMGPPAAEDHAPPPTGDPSMAQASAGDVGSRPSTPRGADAVFVLRGPRPVSAPFTPPIFVRFRPGEWAIRPVPARRAHSRGAARFYELRWFR